jgi:hypothetical protein
MKARSSVAVILTATVVVAIGGCGRDGENEDVKAAASTTTKRQTIADATLQGYPPRQDVWNLAMAIDDIRLKGAAEFVAETRSVVNRAGIDLDDAEALRARYAEGVLDPVLMNPNEPPQTGGETHRAVAVKPADADRVEVTVCDYATPGVFVRGPGDRLVLRSFATDRARFAYTTSTVEWTTDRDGRGRTSAEPRWLVVQKESYTEGNAAKAVCEPHLPTPFEFAPPRPTSTALKHTTRTDNESILAGYPPRNDIWDIAIQIDDTRARSVAEFVGETESLYSNALLNQQDADAYRTRVGPNSIGYVYPIAQPEEPQTGGDTIRVVDVTPIDDSRFRVSFCGYPTPGVYVGDKFGDPRPQTRGPIEPRATRAGVDLVEWTRGPDDLGRTSAEPRWLVVDWTSIAPDDTTGASRDEICGPFVPDPFVVAPPEPTGPR